MQRNMIALTILTLIILPIASASLVGDLWSEFTGQATSEEVGLKINVTGGNAPTVEILEGTITDVSAGLNEAPSLTTVSLAVKITGQEGLGNINDSTIWAVFTKSGEETRSISCIRDNPKDTEYSKTFNCNVEMFWWDSPGTWRINASAADINNNYAENTSITFNVGATAGFTAYPEEIIWAAINPGATDETAINWLVLNNTGNIDRALQVNATNLLGETDNTKILLANDFSIDINAGCAGTGMSHLAYTPIAGANLPRGDFRLNDLSTGQEELFFCLNRVGQDITEQTYSTNQEGSWTVKIA